MLNIRRVEGAERKHSSRKPKVKHDRAWTSYGCLAVTSVSSRLPRYFTRVGFCANSTKVPRMKGSHTCTRTGKDHVRVHAWEKITYVYTHGKRSHTCTRMKILNPYQSMVEWWLNLWRGLEKIKLNELGRETIRKTPFFDSRRSIKLFWSAPSFTIEGTYKTNEVERTRKRGIRKMASMVAGGE